MVMARERAGKQAGPHKSFECGLRILGDGGRHGHLGIGLERWFVKKLNIRG